VHCKSLSAQEMRALLGARKLIQSKLFDMEMSLRGTLRGFGLKVGHPTEKRFAERIRELVAGQAMLEAIAEALLAAREVLLREFKGFEKRVRVMARSDARVRLLMSAPGVGAIVAVTYASAVDDPGRFKSSKGVGPHFGLTPKKYQSGCPRHSDAAGQGLGPQELGDEARQARRHAEGEGGARAQARRHPAPNAGGRHELQVHDQRYGCGGVTKERSRTFGRHDTSHPEAKSRRWDDGRGQAAAHHVGIMTTHK
jgi:hypothetical protein